MSALHLAALNGHNSIGQKLIAAGANVNAVNNVGQGYLTSCLPVVMSFFASIFLV